VTFGEALVVLVQSDPGPLEDSARFTRSLGGAELNVAVGLAAHGVETSVITRVGNDGFGRFVVDELVRLGVDVSGIDVDPVRQTGMYIKEVGGSTGRPSDLGPGSSRMHYYRTGSAASALSPATLRIPEVERVLTEASLIHTSGITPALSDQARAAQYELVRSRRPGQLLAFDLNWRPRLWRGRESDATRILSNCVRGSDIALLGANEARAVFGLADPGSLRREFPEPRWLIVKNDGNAATAFDGDVRVDVPALSIEIVEAIGAGDAFASGVLAGILSGAPLAESVEQAHRVAARALASPGDHVGSAPPAPPAHAAPGAPLTRPAPGTPPTHPAPDGGTAPTGRAA
jgi:2-dehydro-3-deoxygluconokinase